MKNTMDNTICKKIEFGKKVTFSTHDENLPYNYEPVIEEMSLDVKIIREENGIYYSGYQKFNVIEQRNKQICQTINKLLGNY